MGGFPLQVLRQVDDHDGIEGAFLQQQKPSCFVLQAPK
jgi:hypothetical protein